MRCSLLCLFAGFSLPARACQERQQAATAFMQRRQCCLQPGWRCLRAAVESEGKSAAPSLTIAAHMSRACRQLGQRTLRSPTPTLRKPSSTPRGVFDEPFYSCLATMARTISCSTADVENRHSRIRSSLMLNSSTALMSLSLVAFELPHMLKQLQHSSHGCASGAGGAGADLAAPSQAGSLPAERVPGPGALHPRGSGQASRFARGRVHVLGALLRCGTGDGKITVVTGRRT